MFKQEIKENIFSILPIATLIFILSAFFVPISNYDMVVFFISSVLLIIGIGLFKKGASRAMLPMGERIGANLSKSRKLSLFILIGLIVGFIVTFAEPDLLVLAMQIVSINKWLLILTVAIGVSIFLMLGVLRIIFQFDITKLLFISYVIVIVLSFFTKNTFFSLAFDSGTVTSGPISVPFILALGAGISAVRSSKTAKEDSFGLIALISVGPIIFVMLLGLFIEPNIVSNHIIPTVSVEEPLLNLFSEFFNSMIISAYDVSIILVLLSAMFLVFNVNMLKLPKSQLFKIGIGLLYTFLGLTLFLSAVSVGYLPLASILGFYITKHYAMFIIPIGLLFGLSIIFAEPAILILVKKIEELTSKMLSKKVMLLAFSVSFSVALFISIIRVIFDLPLIYILLPLYIASLVLLFLTPKLFSAIAFDSGGVCVSSLSTGFLLPFVMGISFALGNDILISAFGTIAILATMPILAVQMLGLFYKAATNGKVKKQQHKQRKRITIYEFEV